MLVVLANCDRTRRLHIGLCGRVGMNNRTKKAFGLGFIALFSIWWIRTGDHTSPVSLSVAAPDCSKLSEVGATAMALRQLGSDEPNRIDLASLLVHQDMSAAARSIVSRAFAEPIVAGREAKALATRNFADSIEQECLS